jgi:hypothetical protein
MVVTDDRTLARSVNGFLVRQSDSWADAAKSEKEINV